MFFIDSNGNLISSIDGKSMTSHLGMTSTDITDMNPATVIPGLGANMASVNIEDYIIDFQGIQFKGQQIISWSPCCTQPEIIFNHYISTSMWIIVGLLIFVVRI